MPPPTRRRILLTGGSAGLGRVIATALHRRGDKILVVGRDPARLRQLADQLPGTQICPADVTHPADCHRVVATTLDHFGGIDALINVVGRSDRGRIESLTADHLRTLIDANVIATLNMSTAAAAPLKQSRGVVVNVGSIAGRVAPRYLGGYAIAKHALSALTQQLRLEWADDNVHVGLISPGPIRRDDAGNRYNDRVAADNLPASAATPGGGAKLKGLDPQIVADAILKMIDRRTPDVVLPGYLRVLIAAGHLSPRLGDWMLTKMMGSRGEGKQQDEEKD